LVDIKKRRISKKDWDSVQEYVKKEKKIRENDRYRKEHEAIWREVDRQISMQPVSASKKDIKDNGDWHNAIELGNLAEASEILTADAIRLSFPASRAWMQCHAELPAEINESTGERKSDPKQQKRVDGRIRSLMTQQHKDFGFKARVKLSLKEALHHGSFVVEVVEEDQMLVSEGSGIQSLHAPVWKPYSMWNAYPDPSPSVIGANTIYSGSMILTDFMPLERLKIISKGEGWMTSQVSKVKTKKNKNKDVETEDVELCKYYGDISIQRNDGDIYLPNSKVILANGIIVYYSPVETPFPPIIYGGYERQDVRDPYYTSPLIKLSPTQKMASRSANKFLDSVDLETEPPIVYDASDPSYVENGGPLIAPGSKTPTRGSAKYEVIQAGSSQSALQGLTFAINQLERGTAVNAVRSGGSDSVEKTKAEVTLADQRGEVRIVDFVEDFEKSLCTFLYMQHYFNRKNLERYPFYNPEMDAPDFEWITKNQLPENVQFEIVGAKGVLGEEQRTQKTMAVTAFASQNPLFANLIKPVELLLEAYQDAGNKNPERFINVPDDETTLMFQQLQQQMQEQVAQIQQEAEMQVHQLQKELDIQKAVNDAKVVEAQMKSQAQIETSQFKAEVQASLDTIKAHNDAQIAKFEAMLEAWKAAEAAKPAPQPPNITVNMPKNGKKRLTRTENGYEAEDID